MALVSKSAVVQIRLDPDLLASFQRVCESKDVTVSHQLRDWIHRAVFDFEQRMSRIEARRPVSFPVPAPESFALEKTPPDPVKTAPKGKNREQRRSDKKRGL